MLAESSRMHLVNNSTVPTSAPLYIQRRADVLIDLRGPRLTIIHLYYKRGVLKGLVSGKYKGSKHGKSDNTKRQISHGGKLDYPFYSLIWLKTVRASLYVYIPSAQMIHVASGCFKPLLLALLINLPAIKK